MSTAPTPCPRRPAARANPRSIPLEGAEPAMTALESPDYQVARDRIKGNPVVSKMAAGVAAVPLAELAHEDGTPRFAFMQHASRAFDKAESQNAGNPRYEPYPAYSHSTRADRRASLAERAAIREAVASAMAAPGTGPESDGDPDHRADAGRGVTRGDRPRDRDAALAPTPGTGSPADPRPAPVSQPQAPIRQRGRKDIVKVQAFLVSGEFRVHRAGCQDTAREARRSDSAGHPEEYASKAAVIRALWADIIAEDPDTYGTPGGIAALEAETRFLACTRGLPGE